jgi:hypothetical protein
VLVVDATIRQRTLLEHERVRESFRQTTGAKRWPNNRSCGFGSRTNSKPNCASASVIVSSSGFIALNFARAVWKRPPRNHRRGDIPGRPSMGTESQAGQKYPPKLLTWLDARRNPPNKPNSKNSSTDLREPSMKRA